MGERGFGEPVRAMDVNENYEPNVKTGRDYELIRAVAFAGALLVIDILVGVACLVVTIAK